MGRRRIAVLAGVTMLVIAGGIVALRITTGGSAAASAGAADYTHEHLVWQHRAAGDGSVQAVAFSPDGATLAIAEPDGPAGQEAVTLWRVSDHRRIAALPCPGTGGLRALAFSPDGRTLAITGVCSTTTEYGWTLQLWDTASDRLITTLPAGNRAYLTLAFSSDGDTLAAGGTNLDADAASIDFWDVKTHRAVGELAMPDQFPNVKGFAYSPNGSMLAVSVNGGDAPTDNAVQLWDVARRHLIATLANREINGVAFSPDGNTVAAATLSDVVQLYGVRVHRPDRALITNRERGVTGFWSVAFSPDGRVVAAVDLAGVLTMWDPTNGRIITTLSCGCQAGQIGFVTEAFSPDGALVAAGGVDGIVDMWSR